MMPDGFTPHGEPTGGPWPERAPTLPALREDAHGVQNYTGPDLRLTLITQLSDPATPIEIRKQILDMMLQLEDRHARIQFNRAVAELQPKLPVIRKNGLIQYKPGTKPTKYSKWDDVYKACMPVLAEHGFSCGFSSELQGGNALKVTMTVKHVGGGEDTGSLTVPWLDTGGSKSPAQAAASSYTLAERHVFIKYWNILTEDVDDDGSGKGVPERITEAQLLKLEDIIAECENREPGKFTLRFKRWLKEEFHTEVLSELFQGEQYEAVMGKLREKMASLGVK